LENWDDEVVDWVVANWNKESCWRSGSRFKCIKKIGKNKDFQKIIGVKLDLSKENRQSDELVGDLGDIGF
jgi:hypothetical protein